MDDFLTTLRREMEWSKMDLSKTDDIDKIHYLLRNKLQNKKWKLQQYYSDFTNDDVVVKKDVHFLRLLIEDYGTKIDIEVGIKWNKILNCLNILSDYHENNKEIKPEINIITPRLEKFINKINGITTPKKQKYTVEEYKNFCKTERIKIKDEIPNLTIQDTSRELGKRWQAFKNLNK